MSFRISRQLGWAWTVTEGHRSKMVLYILLGVASVALSLGFVYASKHAVDVATGVASGSLTRTCFWIVATVAAGIVVEQVAAWICEIVRVKMTIRLQNSLIDAQMMAAWETAKRWHTGDLLVRIREDGTELVKMLAQTLPSFCVTCIKLTASLAFLWFIDPLLATMILIISPLFLFSKLYYKKMRRLSEAVKQAESRLGVVMQESLKHRLLVRALNIIGIRRERLFDSQEQLFGLKLNQLKFSTCSQLILRITFNGGYLLAFLWGVYRLHNSEISFGTLAAFLQLVGRIQTPVLAAVSFVPAAVRCLAAIDRLMELYETDRESEEFPMQLCSPVRLRLENLSFHYEDREVFKNINACILPGEPTAVVGVTGKGKTTLVRLMLGLVKPQKGAIWLETEQKQRVSVATRAHFSYVPQGNSLFSGSIRDNLLQVRYNATEGEMREALTLACAGFVYSLPQGLDTFLGESGYGLSEGQAQRIAVARALLQGGGIWLFDEVTSALDARTATSLTQNLLEAGKDKILIFVTHDSHLMELCSQIIRLD